MALYRIKEFPTDGAFWRIDWIGKAQPNIDVETEPAIQVHFTKLKPGYQDPLARDSLLIDDQVTKAVGLGQLPLLTAGSVWKDGRLHSHLPPTKRETFEVDTSQELSHIFKGEILVDGNGYDLVPPMYYPVRRHFSAMADAPLAVFPAPAKSRVEYYIIPRFELFRFYYACSSKLARYVWDNSIESAINPAKSGRLEGGDVRIYLRRHMLDREAYMLGRWLASDVMSQQIQSFRNLRSTRSVNRIKGEPAALHLDIGFPFTGKTKLVAAGKKIQLHTSNESGREVWAFLVLHLQHCSHPMPYRDIIVDRENRNFQGLNKDDENLPFAWPKNSKVPDDAPDNGGEPDTAASGRISTVGADSVRPVSTSLSTARSIAGRSSTTQVRSCQVTVCPGISRSVLATGAPPAFKGPDTGFHGKGLGQVAADLMGGDQPPQIGQDLGPPPFVSADAAEQGLRIALPNLFELEQQQVRIAVIPQVMDIRPEEAHVLQIGCANLPLGEDPELPAPLGAVLLGGAKLGQQHTPLIPEVFPVFDLAQDIGHLPCWPGIAAVFDEAVRRVATALARCIAILYGQRLRGEGMDVLVEPNQFHEIPLQAGLELGAVGHRAHDAARVDADLANRAGNGGGFAHSHLSLWTRGDIRIYF